MNEQQIKDRLHTAIDNSLSGLEANPYLHSRVLAQLQEGEQKMKKGKLSLSLVLVTIIAVCTLTAALAAGIFGRVNWMGEIVPDDPSTTLSPLATSTPAPEMQPEMDFFERSNEIMSARKDKELVVVYDSYSSGTWMPIQQTVHSYDEFLSIMAGNDYLPLPEFIPDGYEFSEGSLHLECMADGAFNLTSRETTPEGFIVERYSVDDDKNFIGSYELIFRKPGNREDYIAFYVSLEFPTDPTEHSFGLNPDQSAIVLEINGMDNALAILSNSRCCVNMRRELENGIDYLQFLPEGRTYVETFGEVHVDIVARQLDAETLASTFDKK